MTRSKTKYSNVYYDNIRKKYEYRKMVNGSLLFGRADTAAEALNLLVEHVARNNGTATSGKKVSLPNFDTVLRSYLADRKESLKASSLQKLKYNLNLYFDKRFRKVPVDKLNDDDFRKWYNFIKKREVGCALKNQLLWTLKHIFRFVKIMYNYECVYVERLHRFRDDKVAEPDYDFRIFDLDDFQKLYPRLNEYDRFLLLTLFLLGPRCGELLGLTPKSFLLDKKIMLVHYQVSWKTGKKGWVITTPKSKKSDRIYPTPDCYITYLLNYIKSQGITENGFIFYSPRCKDDPISPSTLQRKLDRWSEVVGYHLYPHFFRHSSVSQLYASGLSLGEIQQLMGHSSEKVTKDYYLHSTKGSRKALTDFMDDLMSDL